MKQKRNLRKWDMQEEERLIRQVRAFPQNLKKCFLIVAEEVGRTPGAVANHWYTKTSKDPKNLCFFTASEQHVSPNRKNGLGMESSTSVWKKLVKAIRSIIGL